MRKARGEVVEGSPTSSAMDSVRAVVARWKALAKGAHKSAIRDVGAVIGRLADGARATVKEGKRERVGATAWWGHNVGAEMWNGPRGCVRVNGPNYRPVAQLEFFSFYFSFIFSLSFSFYFKFKL